MFARLVLLFTLVPLVELYLLVQVGRIIGLGPTIAMVIGTGILGAWLTRLQGLRVLRQVQTELQQGKVPTEALVEGLLILIAGAVLLTPGLITDALGFMLLVPQGRQAIRRALVARFSQQVQPVDPNVIDTEWRREE